MMPMIDRIHNLQSDNKDKFIEEWFAFLDESKKDNPDGVDPWYIFLNFDRIIRKFESK